MVDEPSERRRAERVPVNAEFGAMPSMVYVSDLSEHGVFVHTDKFVPLGTTLQVRFTVLLDDPVVISARGRVVRHQHDPQGVGIEFTRVTPDMVLRIGDIVAQQRPRELPLATALPEAPRRTATTPPTAPRSPGDTRVTRPPIDPPADTKVVTAPVPPTAAEGIASAPASAPDQEQFDASQTLVKLQAVDVEILDDDDVFDDDAGTSSPRGRRP
jgi:hypothetical protein